MAQTRRLGMSERSEQRYRCAEVFRPSGKGGVTPCRRIALSPFSPTRLLLTLDQTFGGSAIGDQHVDQFAAKRAADRFEFSFAAGNADRSLDFA
jgi:hypothetical protein